MKVSDFNVTSRFNFVFRSNVNDFSFLKWFWFWFHFIFLDEVLYSVNTRKMCKQGAVRIQVRLIIVFGYFLVLQL